MKAGNILGIAAAAAAAAALPIVGGELHAIADGAPFAQRDLSEQEQRELMHYTVIFEECVGKTRLECETLIQAEVAANPQIFDDAHELEFEVATVRSAGDADYYMVGMRTNEAEDGVIGILGDGMVFYPWDWCDPDAGCKQIGPWDCDIGTPLNVTECCNMIKASTPHADIDGNYLECFPDYPVGSVSNPVDYHRVLIHVNSMDIVVHPPRNE